MMCKNNKAYFYSIDALIALIVLFSVLMIVKPLHKEKPIEPSIQYDLLKVASSLKISDLSNDSSIQAIITQGSITNTNNTFLEQAVEFNAKQQYSLSQQLFDVLLGYLYNDESQNELGQNENIGVWVDDKLITAKNSSSFDNSEYIWTAKEIVSGFSGANPGEVKGYSARALLTQNYQTKYFYFGGYVGDGNISAKITYLGTIKSASMEIAANSNFSVYINGIYAASYSANDSFTPMKYNLTTSYFNSGENLVELRGNIFIAGGYIKVNYESSEIESKGKIYFPGIEGVINFYGSLYIPQSLSSMEIFLHYNSSYDILLSVGNKTVYEGNSTNNPLRLNNSFLSSQLNYLELYNKNIPIRIGLKDVYNFTGSGNADVILITDLSGSMDYRIDSDYTGITRNCTDPLLYDSSTKRISLAKCLDKMVIDIILNASGNRLALSAFYGDTGSPYKGRVYEESLTNNTTYLNSRIELYSPQGGTCICCSINDAYKILNEQSNSSRKKFVIVMSDGIPTHTCQAASGCQGTRTGLQSDEGLWLGWGAGCYGGLDDCDVNDCNCASQNANWSSCRLRTGLNATSYSIGFGPLSTCLMANKTLQDISQCGGGKYYTTDNATLLAEIYSSIAKEILNISYTEQTSYISGSYIKTTLYPDSFVILNYSQASLPYGLVFTTETDSFGNTLAEGNFTVSQDSEIVEARAISYSGAKWTDYVLIKNDSDSAWRNIFNLSEFGSNYLSLGDPYSVTIQTSKLSKGLNKIKITTGINSQNSSQGSASNKLIYTLS